MVAISTVRSANATLYLQPAGLVSVFVGATSGIGLSTVTALAKFTTAPKVYIIGRSASRAAELLSKLRTLNPQGSFIFIEAQVSLLKDVEVACKEIKEKETHIDLLFLSAGALSVSGRQETPEGLDITLSVSYYSRQLFTTLLLPLLAKAPSPRVVSVLGAGKEDKLVLDDLELTTHYSVSIEATQQTTMNSLFMDTLARENPQVSFVHAYPGVVKTGLLDSSFGRLTGIWSLLGVLMRWLVLPVLNFWSIPLEEAGERGLDLALGGRYNPQAGQLRRVDWNGEDAKDVPVLNEYIAEGVGRKVWDHTLGIFERVLAGE